MRRCVSRLRQRWLAGHRAAHGPPVAEYSGRRDHPPLPQQSRRHLSDVTEKSGLGRSVWASGITVGDYDNDGDPDKSLYPRGAGVFCCNSGDQHLRRDQARRAAPAGTRFGSGCTWIDYGQDEAGSVRGALHGVRPGARSRHAARSTCTYRGVPVYCRPAGMPQERCRLYHNNGDGTFTDASQKSGILAVEPGYGLTAVAAVRWRRLFDICVASDRSQPVASQ